MKFYILLSFIFSLNLTLKANPTIKKKNKGNKTYLYNDGVVSMKRWYNGDKKIDSVKTYYKTGELDEAFYYPEGRLNGKSYKYNKEGKKLVTWTFKNGKLLKRQDHKIIFNKKNEKKMNHYGLEDP